ncbi:MAG: bifunctional riboflavin kinase/FAD synthetase [Acidobacteria bacterium]|nr:bifunctional riboflavin kinase/FAD synthetase [Acidobacteriota bacterium]
MRVFRSLAECRGAWPETVATVGNFDGVHLAHRDLLQRLRAAAARAGAASLLVTFEPHPLRVLAPETAPPRLATERQKLELVEREGIDFAVVIPFDRDFAAREPDAFVREILQDHLRVRTLLVGPTFFFGRGRRGDVEFLRRLAGAGGPAVEVIAPLLRGGEPISSTRIRADLRAGRIEAVREMLGRPYFVDGTVVPGQKQGQALGIPTANLAVENELIPPDGVYVTALHRSGRRHGSVTNIGSRPTFPSAGHAVETHILEFRERIYGERVRLAFLARLREERRFDDVAGLRDQIRRDIAAARRLLAREEPD